MGVSMEEGMPGLLREVVNVEKMANHEGASGFLPAFIWM